MLKLNYIIIGKLPEEEKDVLLKNLSRGRTQRDENGGTVQNIGAEAIAETCKIITPEEQGHTLRRLKELPAEESLLVSGDEAELRAAHTLGIAALGYLAPEESETAASSCGAPADMYAEGFEEIGWTFLVRTYERHHRLPWTILTTERCIVREFSMEYLDELFALYAGEGMTEHIEPLYSYEEERRYQEAYIEHMYRFYGYGMWIVCDKKTGALIGRAGIEHREELGGELELGYAIGVPWQHKGYATEVCTAILAYAKEELGISSVCCLIEEGNGVSEHLAKKLGLGWRGTLTLDGKRMRKYIRYF